MTGGVVSSTGTDGAAWTGGGVVPSSIGAVSTGCVTGAVGSSTGGVSTGAIGATGMGKPSG